MTETLEVKKVAIIGGGPGGLTVLNELLHTGKDGKSTIVSPTSNSSYPADPAFDEIVVFEQNDRIGGVWSYSKEVDPPFPADVENYSKPESLRPHLTDAALKDLEAANADHPIVIPARVDLAKKYEKRWNKSAVYDHLFTNIPNFLMRFSTSFGNDIHLDKNSKVYEPFATHQNVLNYLNDYVQEYDMLKYVRFNTSVEKVYKKGKKWYVSVCKYCKTTNTFEYYTETFDAVVVSIGRFNVPFFPKIEGLHDFDQAHPGVISHSKSFRSTEHLKGKKVMIVGSSVSALDIAQYLIPICDFHISSNTHSAAVDGKSDEIVRPKKDWVEKVFSDDNVKWTKHGRISRFHSNTVEFEDGTTETGFDSILFCTGYHLYYPFLDIAENKGKEYISISSGFDGNPNYAMNKVDNLYLYTFTISDPTLCHTGIAHNPLFFLTSEANAIAIAGVWSNSKKLPPVEVQREFINNRFKGKKFGFQVYDETTIRDLITSCYALGPENRFDFLPYIRDGEIRSSKEVLCDLFYKFSKGELDEFDKSIQYNDQ
ncbi:hypothetical protein PICMEDRAFT_74797 [Pichia membranifaciens NRRL Y-2026]|uniref:FAD/NAD(P)-binding domain-containing protein n=1 Tax=Pichia membranifaciens NRRL Y-2026 TaxID=763406 RepID=A0A1E3NF36_9ASCO|nr:hypothetical protein PICMEDRAFT_74797 [Pichia membranifaciens NRRL Y-2026]ODQ44188.1 hypothetical protein PICMEDRAFT_74797 [Pichia membranifaciens NRRL Y-2026]